MPRNTSRNSGRRGASIFTGVLIGLTVGAVLAVGVALWATGNNPFRASAPTAPPAPATPDAPETAPSFDFYKVLPSDAPGELPPADKPVAPVPRYYLQAGAFHNASDADNLKAQLALLGVAAVIQTREVPDKGVFHRVRVGPFNAMDEINRTRSLLVQNNIPTTLVKEVPTSQETP
ncbi:MAG: SPOR domain-containing protein [Thiobacillus sp.]|nr:SPOR domain-containing protein [Thiobacillus sp.]